MKMRLIHYFILIISMMVLVPIPVLSADHFQTVPVKALTFEPVLDGAIDDWSDKEIVSIPLSKISETGRSDVETVRIAAGVYNDSFYLFATWEDSTMNTIHKPFIWNNDEERYIRGPQREDRFSIQFAMEGDYTTQWFSGKEFKADMWHWKSSRTNPVNLAQDKMTIISSTPMKKSYKATAQNGRTLYLYRPSDAGDPIYFSKRYAGKEKDIMPKYFFTEDPKGSITDVKAKGVWKNGKWKLELKRKLDTGHPDDVVFKRNMRLKAGIGIFNASKTTDHNISKVLVFQF